MKTSIVIPTYNGLHLLAPCIESIRRYTAGSYEIIVVDNGSSDGTVQWCRQEAIDFVSLPANLGFPQACNIGLQVASGDVLVLLNNDIVVSHRWLSNMLACLFAKDSIGIVGPMSNYVSGSQKSELQYSSLEQFHALTPEANRHDPEKWVEVQRLVGFCMVFRRELVERIGLLDERFSPGHYEDDDYCHRAREAGYQLYMCGDTHVHHYGSASFRQNQPESLQLLIERNHQLFMEKWGFDPHRYI
ncbi:glycosyltransferase family 2 protein [Paenibacillus turpanensis]|uniref:glycosyltransferase family 2 protein n=1 Tax=Paenibacillus turpanensis TaxID=2689078 RepID=UPI001407424C|nr:glycosyltransferase family 2 protein [Paenibacillus turpanensis]